MFIPRSCQPASGPHQHKHTAAFMFMLIIIVCFAMIAMLLDFKRPVCKEHLTFRFACSLALTPSHQKMTVACEDMVIFHGWDNLLFQEHQWCGEDLNHVSMCYEIFFPSTCEKEIKTQHILFYSDDTLTNILMGSIFRFRK